MRKSAKFFRWVWRADAILIFIAAGAVAFGVGVLLINELGARSAWRTRGGRRAGGGGR